MKKSTLLTLIDQESVELQRIILAGRVMKPCLSLEPMPIGRYTCFNCRRAINQLKGGR